MTVNDTARKFIGNLLEAGVALIPQVEELDAAGKLQDCDALARRAVSYLRAAEAVLWAHSDLHNELVELPNFMTLRRFARRFG